MRTLGLASLLCMARIAAAQGVDDYVKRVDLPIGRSYPIATPTSITRVSVADPDVADVVVMGDRDVVVNARATGETDVIVWEGNAARQHYRMQVHAPADRQQIVLSVKFAEVRRDLVRDVGASGLYRATNGELRAGTGLFNTDTPFDPVTGAITLPSTTDFGTVLSNFGTKAFLGLLQLQEQKGDARILAEPHLMAANNEPASFLAGGELPIPIAQASGTGVPIVTITYKEFGIRLNFTAEIVSDSVIKLKLRPEVSTLDYTNAITISGFQIPALQTRRMETTIDVRRDQSLVISGLFDDEREKVRTGVPILMHIPILGLLFSSTNWQRHETELVVVITPAIVDPLHARPQDVLRTVPDTALPARRLLEPRLIPSPAVPVAPPAH
jgi:pilus assembly protein CpaC